MARNGRRRRHTDLLGEGLTALCGGALALNLLLVLGLLAVLGWHGLGYFWQGPLVAFELRDGTRYLGEVLEREAVTDRQAATAARETRIRVKTANRDVTGEDFVWIDERDVVARSSPKDAVLLERMSYGSFHGELLELRRDGRVLAQGPEAAWRELHSIRQQKLDELERVREFERATIGDVNREIEQLRLERRRLALAGLPPAELAERLPRIERAEAAAQARYEALAERLFAMRRALQAEQLVLRAPNGSIVELPLAEVVRAIRPNDIGWLGKTGLYLSRVWEFLAHDPRESNTEGGIFPALFGTVLMVFLMSIAVTPLGVLAALYLREYARQGPAVRIVRIAVNNLAGVPSIVFGVFGLGFFVYFAGGTIDKLFYPESLPTPTFGTGGILWASLTLALLTVPVVIVATEEGLAAVPRVVREGSLALGATKLETTLRVVLPAAAPGILTGLILAMARAAGEVAPLMIVGMVKLADLPLDGRFPWLHLERKFMHLGFHIYDVGFQSPNVEATKPLVFATALLLITVVTGMNLLAISVRNHLRRKYATSAV